MRGIGGLVVIVQVAVDTVSGCSVVVPVVTEVAICDACMGTRQGPVIVMNGK